MRHAHKCANVSTSAAPRRAAILAFLPFPDLCFLRDLLSFLSLWRFLPERSDDDDDDDDALDDTDDTDEEEDDDDADDDRARFFVPASLRSSLSPRASR
jgi:hypothetical protein